MTDSVTVVQQASRVTVTSPGPQGATGPAGPAGQTGAGFEQAFSSASTVLVTHNLGRYPVVAINIGGVEVDADVTYNDLDSVTVAFGAPYSGVVVCS